jgi:DNA invertase Pin-like site-specific DNA recombinase
MLLDVESGALDAIVAVDQDRLVRRVGEIDRLIRLCEKTSTLVLLMSGEIDTTTDDGILKAHLLAVVAENESRKKSTRQRRERQHAAEAGKPFYGRRSYGYDVDNMSVLADEAKIVREIFQRYLSGDSLREIARSLNDRGVLTYSAKLGGDAKWTPRTLRGMLANPRYCGMRTHRGEVVAEGSWRPLISLEDHERAAAMLARNTTPGRPVTHLLAGVAKCGRCGASMVTNAPKNGSRRYSCLKRPEGGCGRVSIIAEPLEEIITGAVLFRLDSWQFRRVLTAKKKRAKKAGDVVDMSLAEIERDLEGLADDFGNRRISRREWMAARAPLERQRDAAVRALQASADRVALAPFTGKEPAKMWMSMDVDAQRRVIRTLIDRVVIAPFERGADFADRVDVAWRV